ncbi:hypothetical protein SASPL_148456 [Salvia splendens]|uniref:Uncharacterized protein n=1 Tax=Salvia splendens TaxID=180675 RepID=A0A8X8W9D1_SALSN|nr:hypothetical protein SASPL_148456 [Salvia splendens]
MSKKSYGTNETFKHPHEVFISMEKIMMTIIHNNVDNDKLSLVLVKVLLNNLRRENQDSEDTPGKSGLETEADLIEGNGTQNSKNKLYYENQGMTSHCFEDPDEAGKAMHGQQEQKPEELHIG